MKYGWPGFVVFVLLVASSLCFGWAAIIASGFFLGIITPTVREAVCPIWFGFVFSVLSAMLAGLVATIEDANKKARK